MIQIFNTYDVSLHRPVLTMSPDPFLPWATNEILQCETKYQGFIIITHIFDTSPQKSNLATQD